MTKHESAPDPGVTCVCWDCCSKPAAPPDALSSEPSQDPLVEAWLTKIRPHWHPCNALRKRCECGAIKAHVSLRQTLLALVLRARQDERELAARIAEDYGDKVNKDAWTITHTMAGVWIAAAIRSGGRAE